MKSCCRPEYVGHARNLSCLGCFLSSRRRRVLGMPTPVALEEVSMPGYTVEGAVAPYIRVVRAAACDSTQSFDAGG